MYYQNYEDYMRSVLGYPIQGQSLYAQDSFYMPSTYSTEQECEKLYPEIYHILNPYICSACSNVVSPVTEQWLNETCYQIYDQIKDNEIVRLTFAIRVENRKEDTKNTNNRNDRNTEETRQFR